jgi:hypothetical protein
VAGGYDEEALFQQALEASKADEDEVCPGYSRTRGRLPTTRGRRYRCRLEFRAAS